MKNKEQAKATLDYLYYEYTKLEEEFKKEDINKACSVYLYEQAQKKNFLKNKDVYFLLRYVITGNYVGAPIGDV